MNKYCFVVSKVTQQESIKKRIEVTHLDKFKALNLLREMYPDDEYVSYLIELKICDS